MLKIGFRFCCVSHSHTQTEKKQEYELRKTKVYFLLLGKGLTIRLVSGTKWGNENDL